MHQRGIASTAEFTVPAARVENLVTTTSRDEVLVYDQDRHHIHHLNPTASAVWSQCNGRRTVSEVAQAAGVDEDAVRLALRKLEDANLLDGTLEAGVRGTTHSRRSFMKKAAVAGAIAVPAIVSISAPHAAAAQSVPGGSTCTGGVTCVKPSKTNAGNVGAKCCVGNVAGACNNGGQCAV
jgi:hypothetical protein